jgi:diadenosine tetraphosphate (Ap4A) HIT family hydrolase
MNSIPVSSCLFCQIANKEKEVEIVEEFAFCYVIKDAFPVTKGHLLIIPYQHVSDWFSVDQKVQFDMLYALKKMKAKLDEEYSPDGYNIGMNCGEAAGQTIMHLHAHLIPRYKGDVANPRGGVRGVIPHKQSY